MGTVVWSVPPKIRTGVRTELILIVDRGATTADRPGLVASGDGSRTVGHMSVLEVTDDAERLLLAALGTAPVLVGPSTRAVAGTRIAAGAEMALRCGATIVELSVTGRTDAPVVAATVPVAHTQFLSVTIAAPRPQVALSLWAHPVVREHCTVAVPADRLARTTQAMAGRGLVVVNTSGPGTDLAELLALYPNVGLCLDVAAAVRDSGPGAAAELAGRFGGRVVGVRVGGVDRYDRAAPRLERFALDELAGTIARLGRTCPVVIERPTRSDDDLVWNLAAVTDTL